MSDNVTVIKNRFEFLVFIECDDYFFVFCKSGNIISEIDRHSLSCPKKLSDEIFVEKKTYEKIKKQAIAVFKSHSHSGSMRFWGKARKYRKSLKKYFPDYFLGKKLILFRKRWEEYLFCNGIKVLSDGKIGIKKWKSRDLPRFVPIKDIDTAIRQQEHILDNYQNTNPDVGEIAKLEYLKQEIERIKLFFLNWKNHIYNPKKMEEKVFELISLLCLCRDESKKSSLQQLRRIALFKDSLGRDNPSVMSARSVASLNRIQKRERIIQKIAIKTKIRKTMLEIYKENMRALIDLVKNNLRTIQDEKDLKIADIEKLLNRSLFYLSALFCLPYATKAQKSRFWLWQAKKFIFKNEQDFKESIRMAISNLE